MRSEKRVCLVLAVVAVVAEVKLLPPSSLEGSHPASIGENHGHFHGKMIRKNQIFGAIGSWGASFL